MKKSVNAEEIKFLIEILEATLKKTKQFKEDFEKNYEIAYYTYELGKERGLELAIRQLNKIMNE